MHSNMESICFIQYKEASAFYLKSFLNYFLNYWNIHIGKQGHMFILHETDFKKWLFDISFLTSICPNWENWDWEKLILLK